jgi:hypothetical protein
MGKALIKLLAYLIFIAAVYAVIFIFTFIVLLIEESWKEMKKRLGGKR